MVHGFTIQRLMDLNELEVRLLYKLSPRTVRANRKTLSRTTSKIQKPQTRSHKSSHFANALTGTLASVSDSKAGISVLQISGVVWWFS